MKKAAIALALILVFTTFAAFPLSTIADDGILIGEDTDIFDIPERTNDGFFTENLGQWDNEIMFIGDTSFGQIGLGKGCVYFNMREIIETEKVIQGSELMNPTQEAPFEFDIKGHVVKYSFEGSNDVAPIGVGPKNHVNNYFYGNDPDEWVRAARNFESIVYPDLYDDIDLKYYFSDKRPKYDLILNPGSDPEDIKVKVDGQHTLAISEDILSIGFGDENVIQDRDLFSYYQDDGSEVRASFDLIDESTFTYSLENYDLDETVIIDPYVFSTLIGGATNDNPTSIHTASNGDIILVGRSQSIDFPTTPGSYDRTHNSGYDLVIFRMKLDGSDLIFSTFIGGSGGDICNNVEIDLSDNIFLLGQTPSVDFPTTFGAFDNVLGGNTDAFVLKLENDGSDLAFSTFIGGDFADSGAGPLKVLPTGEVLIATQAGHGTYPTTEGAFNRTFGGISDIAVTKFSSNGSSLVFSTYIGGAQTDAVGFLEIDDNGDLIIMGRTELFDFPTTSGAFEEEPQGGFDIVLCKMKSDGSDLIFSTLIGGVGDETMAGFLVDDNGNYVIGGNTPSGDFPVKPGSYDTEFNGTNDDYVIKIKKDGSDSIFSTFIGGSYTETFGKMLFGSDSDLIIHGVTTSSDFPTSIDAFDRTLNGTNDHYIFRLKDDGTSMIRSTLLGGSQTDTMQVFLDIDSNLFIGGYSNSTDYPTTTGADNETLIGGYDIVFTEIEYDLSDLIYSTYFGGNLVDNGNLYPDPYGEIFFFGSTPSTDFPTSSGAYDESHNGGQDIFITKYIGGFNEEPNSVSSVKTYSDDHYMDPANNFDIGDRVYIELQGVNPDETKRDFANVNVTFDWSPIELIRVRLRETDINSDIYRGNFIVQLSTLYCDLLTLSSEKDPTKKTGIFIEPPFRPTSVGEVELFTDAGLTNNPENFDHGDIIHIKVTGVDAHPMLENLALVNVTSQKNETFRILLALIETEINSGVYTGTFKMPGSIEYFDNITVFSVRDEAVKDTVMLHTPVQIRPHSDVTVAEEDEEYRVDYWNFGYETADWTFDPIPSWLEWNQTSTELVGTPNNNHVGLWDVNITLDDSKGHVDLHEFQILVNNKVPSIMVDLITNITEGEEYYSDFDSSDDGQGVIEWSLIGSAPWLSMDQETGILSGRPTMEDVGLFNLTVIVKDGNGGIGSLDFQIIVIGTKKPPRIESLDITSGKQGENYYRDYDAYDPDGNEYDLVWSLETNANFLEIDEYSVLQGTPGRFDVGVFWVIVTVTDLDGLSMNHSFDLTIDNINDKPEWDVIPEDTSIMHGKWYYFNVNATDPDPEGFLEFTVTSDPQTNITIDSNTGELEWFACIGCFKTSIFDLEVNVKVSDGELFVIHSFNIEVIPTQSPTSTLIGPSEGGRMASDNTVVEWSGADPEGESITYDVYIHESQAYVTGLREEALYLSEYDGISLNVGTLTPGILYYWMVLPFDGGTYGTCSSGVLSFKINQKPTIDNIQPQEAKTGEEFSFKVPGSDQDQEDSGNLIYTLNGAPEGMTIKEETGMIRWTPGSDQEGDHVINVLVSDGIETISASFDLEVAKGDEEGFPIFVIIIIIIVLILIILAVLVFLFIRKKKDEEEEIDEESEEIAHQIEEHQKERHWEEDHYHHHEKSASVIAATAMEAHAHDHDKHKEMGYKDLYGSEPPKEGEEETTIEKPKEPREGPEEQIEPPEEEDYLGDLISHMTKTTSNIETYGQELKSVQQEMKSVEDPYDHQGEDEEDIEK